jgi:hypothetical protein
MGVHAAVKQSAQAVRDGCVLFKEIPMRGWCRQRGGVRSKNEDLIQRLPNLNGANAYRMFLGYDYLSPSALVIPVATPKITDGYQPKAKVRRIVEYYTNGESREVPAK